MALKKVTTRRENILAMVRGITSLQKMEFNPKFNYAMSRTVRNIRGAAEDIEEVVSNYTKEFELERQKLVRDYAKRDENGNPVINISGTVIDPSRIDDFSAELDALEEKYKSNIDDNKKYLKEEDEIEVYTFCRSKIPVLSGKNFDVIFDMIEDDNEPDEIEASNVSK